MELERNPMIRRKLVVAMIKIDIFTNLRKKCLIVL
jgi:hypothetical protein